MIEIPTPVADFLENVAKRAKDNGVIFKLEPERSVLYPTTNTPVNGYFDDSPPTLSVAIGQPFDNWFSIFVHESCHMDQFFENTDVWKNSFVPGTVFDTTDIIQLWVDGLIELNNTQLKDYIRRAREVELDCEKRTVEKIKEFNLPIDVDGYVRHANSYIWFYTMLGKTRKWYKIGNEPYNTPAILAKMPNHFNNDYEIVPADVIPLYLEIIG